MKIVHINAIYGSLSTGTIMKDIHDLCLANDIESHVVSPIISGDVELNDSVYKIGNVIDEKIHALMSRITGKQAYFSCLSTYRLIKHLSKIKPDIIHLHNLHNNFISLPMLMRWVKQNGIQLYVTLHDCWFFTGGCTHYTHLGCDKWKQSCGKCPDSHIKLLDSSATVLEDRIMFFQDNENVTVIGVSDWIRKESILNVFRGCKSHTVYNGIDLGVFKYRDSDLRERLQLTGKTIILGPATKWLDPIRKGDLKQFASMLKDNEVLLLFGCKDMNISVPKRVRLYGFTHNREELAQLYSIADVFANCTYEESLSLINVECQACGTPVVTFDNTGVSETVDGVSGLRVENGNYQKLLEACRELILNNNQGLKELRQSFIRDRFERETNYQKMIDLYLKSNQSSV